MSLRIPEVLCNGGRYISASVYNASTAFANYILSTSEIIGGWIGLRSTNSYLLAEHTFQWMNDKIELIGGTIGWGSAEFAHLSHRGATYAFERLTDLGGAMRNGANYLLVLLQRGGVWAWEKIIFLGQQIEFLGGEIGHISSLLYEAVNRCALFILQVANGLGEGIGFVATTLGINLLSAARLTIHFIRENWEYILAHLVAWAVVIICSGIIYGFEAVALPLIIGLGCGLAFGGITGILTVKIFDDNDSAQGRNTAWDALNHYLLHRLPSAGVKTILLSLSVTVLLAAAVVYPYALGAIFGLVVGNHAITIIGFGRNLTHLNREEQIQSLHLQAQELNNQVQNILQRINELEVN